MIIGNHSIGLHRRFAFLWIHEAGMLTIQFGWLIVEITTPASCEEDNNETKQTKPDAR
jgi:hypothetical protein